MTGENRMMGNTTDTWYASARNYSPGARPPKPKVEGFESLSVRHHTSVFDVWPQEAVSRLYPSQRDTLSAFVQWFPGAARVGVDPRSALRFVKFLSAEPSTGCWLWTGAKTSSGYPSFSVGTGKSTSAHRLSVEMAAGRKVPRNHFACHRCDVKLCVNPGHLYVGTRHQNVRDAVERNRLRRGVMNHKAKLNPDKVREIRRAHASGESLASIARRHDMTYPPISDIVHRRSWAHVEDTNDKRQTAAEGEG